MSNGQARRRARTHAALLGAALELLQEGRSTASVEEITRRAGVGFGSFYNHFETKEDLFAEATYEVLDNYVMWLRGATQDLSDLVAVFARSFRLTGRLAGEQPHLLAPLLTQGTEVLLVERGLREAALSDITEGIASGRFVEADPELLLMTVGGALLGLLRLLISDADRDAAETTDVVTERLLCLLGLTRSEARRIVAGPLPADPDPRPWLPE